MFKSIDYIRVSHKIDSHIINTYYNVFDVTIDVDTNYQVFNLVDSDFECELIFPLQLASKIAIGGFSSYIFGILILLEYQKRNYSHKEIVNNIFKSNLYLCGEYKVFSFEEALNCQRQYLNKFNKNYYTDLKYMYDSYKVFI